MSTMTANGNLHVLDNPLDSPSSPSSPSSPFQTQQTASRNFVTNIRGQNSPFPTTPTSSHINGFFEPPAGLSYADFIRTWTDSHVARWLADIKCGTHAATFKANDIRGDVLLELDQATLLEMGVSSIGDRLRILNAVKSLRQRSAARVVSTPVLDSNRPKTTFEHANDAAVAAKNKPDPSATSRSTPRRLDSGRPAPLQLNSTSSRNDLPRLVRGEQPPDSARSIAPSIRPLPQPNQSAVAPTSNGSAGTPNSNHSSASSTVSRPGLPPLPPPPRGQPPLPPPGRPPARSALGGGSQGRRTPTQGDAAPAYTTLALPPAPQTQLLTPSSAGSNWYGLPADPRPGNQGGVKAPQAAGRSTSPIPPSRPNPRLNAGSPAHNKSSSLGLNSPVSSSPGKSHQPPLRSNSHPYATNPSSLQPPNSRPVVDLSPIMETFGGGQTSGTPSPPSLAYSVGRGPFNNPVTPSHSAAPSLDDLRRKLVKFFLPDEGLTFTIDVDTCVGGVEVIEKVLKKFGKGGARSADSESPDYVTMQDGGLSVDGWGVYVYEGLGDPLDEAGLLSVCHAPHDHPAREHPLILRKIGKYRRNDDRPGAGSSSPMQNKFLQAGPTSKATKRASALSILSDLGVHNPEQALESPSPTFSGRRSPAPSGRSSPAAPQSSKKPSKLRNFFGQRPPSELITTHLQAYFPNTEKKVLERTARHSMLRSTTVSLNKRDSVASWNPPPASRFSSSTQGSGTRNTNSPTRTSFSSYIPSARNTQDLDGRPEVDEEVPRVSLSTEDGRHVDLYADETSPRVHPQLLPPIPFPTESFSESLEGITTSGNRFSRPVSRAMSTMSTASRASRRMSYMTELRSKRDRSDTASLMTVDEITAKVEQGGNEPVVTEQLSSDTDDWTQVGSEESAYEKSSEDTDNTEEEEDEEDEEEEEEEDAEEITLLDDDEDVEPQKVTMRKGNKWIKGALIGAGSFGKVYLGMDASTGLLMAVKQVELPTGSAPNQERKQSMLTALEREIDLLQDLQHENIVQYLYSSLEDDCLNIFLEYVPGGSVTALLRSYGAFEEPLVKNFVRQILQGLGYLHGRDIIHRDIKGANILVDNKGGVKISDFGISKKVDVQVLAGNRAHRPSLQGSVFWMAPEVVKQSGHTQKADIWSVGCLVVEMLTGEHPYPLLTQMQAIFKIGSSAKPTIPSDISAEAQDFLGLTFEIDHEARPSASKLLEHHWLPQKKGGA